MPHEEPRRAGWWWRRAEEVGGLDHLETEAGEVRHRQPLHGRRLARQHPCAVHRVEGPPAAGAVLIGADVVGVRPDAILRIVREGREVERIARPRLRLREVIARGQVDAQQVAGAGELGQHPAIGQLVEKDDRIARSAGRAGATRDEARHREVCADLIARRLVVDGDLRTAGGVDRHHELQRADVAGRVVRARRGADAFDRAHRRPEAGALGGTEAALPRGQRVVAERHRIRRHRRRGVRIAVELAGHLDERIARLPRSRGGQIPDVHPVGGRIGRRTDPLCTLVDRHAVGASDLARRRRGGHRDEHRGQQHASARHPDILHRGFSPHYGTRQR